MKDSLTSRITYAQDITLLGVLLSLVLFTMLAFTATTIPMTFAPANIVNPTHEAITIDIWIWNARAQSRETDFVSIAYMEYARNWACTIVMGGFVLLTFWWARRLRREQRGLCGSCGFDVRATTSANCPECGAHIRSAAG